MKGYRLKKFFIDDHLPEPEVVFSIIIPDQHRIKLPFPVFGSSNNYITERANLIEKLFIFFLS